MVKYLKITKKSHKGPPCEDLLHTFGEVGGGLSYLGKFPYTLMFSHRGRRRYPSKLETPIRNYKFENRLAKHAVNIIERADEKFN